MSNGALDRTTFEAIEAYVLERMDAAERMAFEQRMAGDAALREEVELERENIRAVELGGVTRVLKEIAATEHGSQGKEGGWSRYLKYAAVIAALATGAWWFARPSANERIFAQYYAADPGLPVAMSSSDDPAFADAMVSYKEGKYAEARAKWEPLLKAEPMNDTLRYFTASARLAEGDASAAIPMLAALSIDSGSAFTARAKWYLLLAYVRSGEHAKARAIALEGDPEFGERARAIKERLK